MPVVFFLAVDKASDIRAAVSTDLELHNALRRRGVAYDVAQAMSFEKHEELINLFFNEMQREPLEGFQKVSLEQVAAADREVHVRLAEKTRGGLARDAQGGLPLDGPLGDVIVSSEVRWLLMPMPKRAPMRAAEPTKKADGEGKPTPKGPPKKTPQGKAGANPNPKKIRKSPIPAPLHGRVPSNKDGKLICFGDCTKGLHICCHPKCFLKHSFISKHRAA